MNESLLRGALESVLGADSILPPEDNAHFAIDGKSPQVVALPKTVEEVSRLLSVASREQVSVIPWGGGAQMALGNIPRRVDLVMGLSRLNRVLDHQPQDLTVTVEAGVTLGELQSLLAPAGQYLPIDPPLPDGSTIGGILATNASGPLRLSYGTARDMLLGIKVVNAEGVITRAGGRVVKNVAGYDMNKLYTGSLGTIGVIVEATFKVAPIPRERATLFAHFDSVKQASEFSHRILHGRFRPLAMECIAGLAQRAIKAKAGLDIPETGYSLAVFFGGVAAAVERQLQEAQALCQETGALYFAALQHEAHLNLWRAIRGLGQNGDMSPPIVTMASVLPSNAFQVVSAILELGEASGLASGVEARLGNGIVYGFWQIDNREDVGMLAELMTRLRSQVKDLNGVLVVERCPTSIKERLDVWGVDGADLAIMRRIKKEFDPKGILNPGRFVGGI